MSNFPSLLYEGEKNSLLDDDDDDDEDDDVDDDENDDDDGSQSATYSVGLGGEFSCRQAEV